MGFPSGDPGYMVSEKESVMTVRIIVFPSAHRGQCM